MSTVSQSTSVFRRRSLTRGARPVLVVAALCIAALAGQDAAAALPTVPGWTVEGGQPAARMGTNLTPAGDVDGDGYADLTTCRRTPDGSTEMLFYRGGPSGPPALPDWSFPGPSSAASCVPFTGIGDVNGDGYHDVALNGKVHYGSASGPPATPSWIGTCSQPACGFGALVAGVGDVNGDGYDDVAFGSPSFYPNGGALLLYLGSATGLPSTQSWTTTGPVSGLTFPVRIGPAGDLNGDGLDDFFADTEGYYPVAMLAGSATAVYCGVLGANPQQCLLRRSDGHHFAGARSTRLGDVNGDGFDDLMVATMSDNNPGQSQNWTAEVCNGSATGPNPCVTWGAASYPAPVRAGVGDTDGDGFDDLLLGFPTYASYAGRVSLYHGGAAGLAVQPDWTVDGSQGTFGASLVGAGDVNGNGLADIVVGAPLWTNPELNEGAIFAFFDPNQAPVALCQALVVRPAGNGCVASVAASEVDAGSFDPEGEVVTLELDPPGPFPLGTTSVTLIVRDGAGLSGTCAAAIDVEDDQDGPCELDNCPGLFNPDQADADADGVGDACDPCPLDAANDSDADGVCGSVDNCPTDSNTDQANADGDQFGDLCDPCPLDSLNDLDGDGVCGEVDNCPTVANSDQADGNGNGIGDLCDEAGGTDSDGDGVPDATDACEHSILDPTVIVPPVLPPPSGSHACPIVPCNSGVPNYLLTDGCSISDKIAACDASTQTRNQFEKCVKRLLNQLRHQRVITEQQRRKIDRCVKKYKKRDTRHHGHDDHHGSSSGHDH